MEFEITVTLDSGFGEWTKYLGVHTADTRSELNTTIYVLQTTNMWAVRFNAVERQTRTPLMYSQDTSGSLVPVGKIFGAAFAGFENGDA